MHCDIAVLDDVVVQENAYTEEGRRTVRTQYSLLASIEGAEAKQWVVGTRYHPNDLYNDMINMEMEKFDHKGNVLEDGEKDPIYDLFKRVVEDIGDLSGSYLWPRQRNPYNHKWYGFNAQILARKKGQYLDKMQFRAQYYNDPSDPDRS